MNKKHLVLCILAIPIVGGFYTWLIHELGWVATLQFIGGMTVVFGLASMCIVAVVAVFFYATLWRSRRYAKRLQESGYAVYINHHEMWSFALLCLMSLVMLPIGIWMTIRAWDAYICIQARQCYASPEWYFIIPIACGLLLFTGLASLCGVVGLWVTSFRPLRR